MDPGGGVVSSCACPARVLGGGLGGGLGMSLAWRRGRGGFPRAWVIVSQVASQVQWACGASDDVVRSWARAQLPTTWCRSRTPAGGLLGRSLGWSPGIDQGACCGASCGACWGACCGASRRACSLRTRCRRRGRLQVAWTSMLHVASASMLHGGAGPCPGCAGPCPGCAGSDPAVAPVRDAAREPARDPERAPLVRHPRERRGTVPSTNGSRATMAAAQRTDGEALAPCRRAITIIIGSLP